MQQPIVFNRLGSLVLNLSRFIEPMLIGITLTVLRIHGSGPVNNNSVPQNSAGQNAPNEDENRILTG